jgi:hypothetical protein
MAYVIVICFRSIDSKNRQYSRVFSGYFVAFVINTDVKFGSIVYSWQPVL